MKISEWNKAYTLMLQITITFILSLPVICSAQVVKSDTGTKRIDSLLLEKQKTMTKIDSNLRKKVAKSIDTLSQATTATTILGDSSSPIKRKTSADSIHLLYFNKNAISPIEMAKIDSAIGIIQSENKALLNFKVGTGYNLYKIIKEKYDYTDDKAHAITETIKSLIVSINRINNDKITAGDTLKLPRLPVNTFKKNKTDSLTQFFDIYNNQAHLSSTKALANGTPSNLKPSLPFNSGALFALKLAGDDLDKFKELVTNSFFDQAYGTKIIEIDTPEFISINYLGKIESAVGPVTRNAAKKDTASIELLRGLSKTNFGTYYVLDSFDGKCPHGNKVMDVIKSTFDQLNIDTANLNIRKVPMDFFGHEDEIIKFLKFYYAKYPPKKNRASLERIQQNRNIDFLKDVKNKNMKGCAYCVPEPYLEAVFNFYFKEMPDVISTSFVALVSHDNLLPNIVNPKTSLVTASLNDAGMVEDLITEKNADSINVRKEPLYSYCTQNENKGYIIVGDRLSQGKFDGSFSKEGSGITTLGQGTGWGDGVPCITSNEKGTSFATPEVAAKLYIAKAYWRSKQEKVDAVDAQARLLMATDIDPAFVGKFGSGGTVNLNKLLQVDRGYVEMNTGEVVPIRFGYGTIDYATDSTLPLKRYDGKTKANRTPTIGGLYVVGNQSYGFFENERLWEMIDVRHLKLSFQIGDKFITIDSLDKFSATYKQISILKNQ